VVGASNGEPEGIATRYVAPARREPALGRSRRGRRRVDVHRGHGGV